MASAVEKDTEAIVDDLVGRIMESDDDMRDLYMTIDRHLISVEHTSSSIKTQSIKLQAQRQKLDSLVKGLRCASPAVQKPTVDHLEIIKVAREIRCEMQAVMKQARVMVNEMVVTPHFQAIFTEIVAALERCEQNNRIREDITATQSESKRQLVLLHRQLDLLLD